MKIKKVLIMAAAIISLGISASCSRNKDAAENKPGNLQQADAVITVSRITGNVTDEDYFYYDDHGNETIIFRASESVQNFVYYEIEFTEDGSGLAEGRTLFGLDDFTPEKPLVISAYIGSAIPARGVLFFSRGIVRHFYLTEDGIEYYGEAITKYAGAATVVSIPWQIQGQEITEIQHRVFEGKGLTEVMFPNNIKIIFERAFANNNLAHVTIPESMLVISHEAFAGNPLASINIGANVELGLMIGLGETGIAFSEAFDNAYNTGGKKAGTYTFRDGAWHLEKWRYVDLYYPYGDGFVTMRAYTYEATAEDIVQKLTEAECLPEGSACLSFTINGRTGHADMNAVYGNALKNTGTMGEFMLVGSLVNTLLMFFELDEITLTEEGKVIETGHVVFDYPIKFMDRY